jgi:hypothetical protein
VTYPKGGSEYGGYPGLVQPEPHDVRMSAKEQLMAAQLSDAADATSGIESVVDDIRSQGAIDRTKQNG